MTEQPPAKKIKISLEPFIDNHVADITNLGQEILKTEVSLPEKLMHSVDRIWFERGEWKDITEASLKKAIEDQQDNKQEDQDENKQDAPSLPHSIPSTAQPPPPGFDIIKLRESVINKLFHAKSEIDVALDVINILAASNRASATTKDLVLPAGSLTATYVTKPKQTMKAQLESTQLNLGLKRTKQKQAADFLKNSAATLKGLVEKEQVFWNEALDLRRNNWQMFPSNQLGNVNTGSSFFVQYGFSEVGSDFNEASMGELKRGGDTADNNALQLSLPHANSRQVAVSISQSQMGQLKIGRNRFSEGILGMIESDETEKKDTTCSPLFSNNTIHSEVQAQLGDAHATVFDAELFSDILAEAQALSSNVRFPDDEIVINIDGHIDLSIRKEPVENRLASFDSSVSPQSVIISRSINLAFRLLLLQHQRYNAWKQKAKYLSTNPKIHPMLAQHDASLLISSAAAQAAAAQAAQISQTSTNPSSQSIIASSPVNSTTGSVANGIQSPKVGQPSTTNNVNPAISTTTPNVVNATVGPSTTVGSGNVTGAVGSSTSVANVASAAMRAQTRSPNQITPRALPQHIPVLLPILSLTRFWVQFDRVRQVIHHLISPLCASIAIAAHFKCELMSMPSSSLPKKHLYDAYPGYTEVALSLSISLFKGPSLKFGLNQSGSISVCLPQTTVVLQNVSEFESFLSREIKVICLQTVCSIANDIMGRHAHYMKAVGTTNKQRFLWQVDKVDEAIHGSIWSSQGADHVWRNITVSMKHLGTSYSVQFQLDRTHLLEEKTYTVELGKHTSNELAMGFREKVFALVKLIIDDAIMTLS